MYTINEGHLDLPDNWKDESINVLSSGVENGISFAITRDKLPWGMKFSEYADKELSAISKSLNEYKEINQSKGEIDNQHAAYLEYTWKSNDGPMHQLLTITSKNNSALVITVTARGKFSKTQKSEMLKIIHSFKFNNDKTSKDSD